MSDLHQYEIRYHWTDNTSHGCCQKTALEWAYSAQEACFQFDLKMKPRNDRYYAIVEAGPVKEGIKYRNTPNAHFHVCQECQKVVACPGCMEHEKSDLYEPCIACLGKKPHKHHCGFCKAEFDCPQNPCWSVKDPIGLCQHHTNDEVRTYMAGKYPPPML